MSMMVSWDGFTEGPKGPDDWSCHVFDDYMEAYTNELDLIDEFQLMVNPLILGGGKALFKEVEGRHALKLVRAKPLKSGKVSLIYSMQS
jgi:dihydrofolate reductase